MLTIYRAML
jgi:hypothetical protein